MSSSSSSAEASSSKQQMSSASGDLAKALAAENEPKEQKHLYQVPASGEPEGLDAFLDAHRPSATQVSAHEFFVWVTAPHRRAKRSQEAKEATKAALADAKQALAELKAACDAIDGDDNIPLRASKAKGKSKAQRKKELKDVFADETIPSLVARADGGLNCGKWLFFESKDYVDATFRTLAQSIANGPLSRLLTVTVHTVKAALADPSEAADRPHMIALYFENIWDPKDGREVMECLFRHHNLHSRAAKSDLYTLLGIDSKHWSGLRSSVYSCDTVIPSDVQEELKAAYRRDREERQKAKKAANKLEGGEGGGAVGAGATSKSIGAQPDVVDEAGFEDEEEEEGGDKGKAKVSADAGTSSAAGAGTEHHDGQQGGKKEAWLKEGEEADGSVKDAVDSETEDEEEPEVARRAKEAQAEKQHTSATAASKGGIEGDGGDEPTSSTTAKRSLPAGFAGGSAGGSTSRPDSAAAQDKRRKVLRKEGAF